MFVYFADVAIVGDAIPAFGVGGPVLGEAFLFGLWALKFHSKYIEANIAILINIVILIYRGISQENLIGVFIKSNKVVVEGGDQTAVY